VQDVGAGAGLVALMCREINLRLAILLQCIYIIRKVYVSFISNSM